jgi:hypothetical protein
MLQLSGIKMNFYTEFGPLFVIFLMKGLPGITGLGSVVVLECNVVWFGLRCKPLCLCMWSCVMCMQALHKNK